MKNKLKHINKIILCIILLMCPMDNTVLGATKDKIKNVESSEGLQSFMDEFFKKNMDNYSVPGAAVIVVKDGEEVFKKGYGYSNLDKKIKVSPDETVFPAASVSKLFTATAIMQLYEKGKINLDENVEKYIAPLKIINNYSEVVTSSNLLTHSSGVDEASELNGNTRNENNIMSQKYYFDNHIPRVVRKPNTTSRYSNHGYNILGYVIEKMAGISYEEYINKNILKPLKMNSSLVRLKNSNTATGYEFINGEFNEVPLAYQFASGSSGINATVSDMKNFMITHLDNGEFKGEVILKKDSSKKMQVKQFSNNEELPGMGYGFIRSYRNGQELVKHEGALPGFTTTMVLIPRENLGIYVATNSLNPLPFNIEEEFLNEFYPKENTSFKKAHINSNKDYGKYKGIYRSYDGISKSNIMKIGFLFDASMDLKITDNKDGTLTLKEYTNAKEENITKLIELKEDVFSREDGKGNFAFKTQDNGEVIYAFNDVSHNSFEKIKLYDSRVFNIALFILVLLGFSINIIVTIVGLIKRIFKCKDNENIKEIKRGKIICFTTSLFNIIGFLTSLILAMTMISINNFSFAYILYISLGILIISVGLNLIGLVNLMNIWSKNLGSKRDRIYFFVVTLENVVFIWLIYYFNFLGFKI